MTDLDLGGLDRGMALCLAEPSSRSALTFYRAARVLELKVLDDGDGTGASALSELCQDILQLHDSVLTLESDPEILERNTLARAISAIFPVLNSIEEVRTLRERSPYDLFIGGLSIISEIAQASQYLEVSRLSASSHFERGLVGVEDRLTGMMATPGADIGTKAAQVHRFMDSLRALDIGVKEKPFIPFLLWTFVVAISYRRAKEMFSE